MKTKTRVRDVIVQERIDKSTVRQANDSEESRHWEPVPEENRLSIPIASDRLITVEVVAVFCLFVCFLYYEFGSCYLF